MSIVEKIKNVLKKGDKYSDSHLIIENLEEFNYNIRYGFEYESPNLGFSHLLELSKIFNTTNIDVDNYSKSGCRTCDCGSEYGNTIQIRNPDISFDEMKEIKSVFGQNLYKR